MQGFPKTPLLCAHKGDRFLDLDPASKGQRDRLPLLSRMHKKSRQRQDKGCQANAIVPQQKPRGQRIDSP
jgi:hypothetical protein